MAWPAEVAPCAASKHEASDSGNWPSCSRPLRRSAGARTSAPWPSSRRRLRSPCATRSSTGATLHPPPSFGTSRPMPPANPASVPPPPASHRRHPFPRRRLAQRQRDDRRRRSDWLRCPRWGGVRSRLRPRPLQSRHPQNRPRTPLQRHRPRPAPRWLPRCRPGASRPRRRQRLLLERPRHPLSVRGLDRLPVTATPREAGGVEDRPSPLRRLPHPSSGLFCLNRLPHLAERC